MPRGAPCRSRSCFKASLGHPLRRVHGSYALLFRLYVASKATSCRSQASKSHKLRASRAPVVPSELIERFPLHPRAQLVPRLAQPFPLRHLEMWPETAQEEAERLLSSLVPSRFEAKSRPRLGERPLLGLAEALLQVLGRLLEELSEAAASPFHPRGRAHGVGEAHGHRQEKSRRLRP